MNKHFTPAISEEKFAAWLDGMLPADEMRQIGAIIEADNDLHSLLGVSDFIEDFSSNEDIFSSNSLPQIDNEFLDENIAAIMDINNIQNVIENMDPNIYVADGHYGEINPIQQGHGDTCAIKSQQLILNDFGIPCTEEDLIQYSYEHGWYQGNGSGTTMIDVGNLLETAGIPVTRQAEANVFNLVSELAQGHKIIVGVDSAELWHNQSVGEKIKNWLNDFFRGDTPDHALIVAGIDTSDPNNIQVLVTDPGSGDYCKAYPLEQFMDAWADSCCYMVSTDISVPQNVTGMENFNPEIGHIDNIIGVPYADFQIFNDMSYGLPIYAPIDMGYCCPMDSFTNAYLDYARQQIAYMDIFGGDYMFNDYLQPDLITPQMQGTYDFGLTQINFNPMNNWDNYAMAHNIPVMTNADYNDFLNHSIADFTAMGDMQSAMYCEQQMMMLDYCNNFGYDFYDTFYC